MHSPYCSGGTIFPCSSIWAVGNTTATRACVTISDRPLPTIPWKSTQKTKLPLWARSCGRNPTRQPCTRHNVAPYCHLSASHDGYADSCSTHHKRDIEWPDHHRLKITDRFSGPGGFAFRGAFHLGPCNAVNLDGHRLIAEFGSFSFSIDFPPDLKVDIFFGSDRPFLGWHSAVYGKWKPNYSVVYSGVLNNDHLHTIQIEIDER